MAAHKDNATRRHLIGVTLAALMATLPADGCSNDHARAGDSPPSGKRGAGPLRFSVEVQRVDTRRLDYLVSAVGAVDAFEHVQVAARVVGAIERVTFSEGERVAKGRPLVYIDTERYHIAVEAAHAALARARAERAEAEASLDRRAKLVADKPDVIAVEELDSWRARAAVAAADEAIARAAVAKAELEQRYAAPGAPFAGIIETRNIVTGQYVQLGTQLATLIRRDPLLLRFAVSDTDAAALKLGMRIGFTTQQTTKAYTARLTYIAQGADAASRMVACTAEVDDARKDELRPGTFAQVAIVVGSRDRAPVVPQMAIRPSERGFVAYVVTEEVVHERVLRLGMRTADGYVEVQDGLADGDTIVVRGAEALTDGAKVTTKLADPMLPSPGAPRAEAESKAKATE